MTLRRASGVQLHITSLPGGRLGAEARAFAGWLAAAGQSYWQVLPLGPPDRWGSPYKSRSAFACWPRLLERPDAPVSAGEEDDFRTRHAFWIDAWAAAAGGRRAIRDQVRFEREWQGLRRFAAERGVAIIGDMPLYVAPGSVDHHVWPRLFARGLLAGAPPDDFNPMGQLWGNPVYDWPAMRRSGYRWWIERMRRATSVFDLVRLDHFRGLVAYWAIPERTREASHGSWRRGPLGAPLQAARRALGSLPLLAEDLGVITPPVERLRERLGIPGMAVVQFVYDARRPDADPLDEAARGRLLYTATHDQDTLLGWWDSLTQAAREPVLRALRRRGITARADAGAWPLIRLVAASPARVSMMQMQDVLGLGSCARMNTPGKARGNWSWRMHTGAATPALARRLRSVTVAAERGT
jgi:4-alpha-glucanotransferase